MDCMHICVIFIRLPWCIMTSVLMCVCVCVCVCVHVCVCILHGLLMILLHNLSVRTRGWKRARLKGKTRKRRQIFICWCCSAFCVTCPAGRVWWRVGQDIHKCSLFVQILSGPLCKIWCIVYVWKVVIFVGHLWLAWCVCWIFVGWLMLRIYCLFHKILCVMTHVRMTHSHAQYERIHACDGTLWYQHDSFKFHR